VTPPNERRENRWEPRHKPQFLQRSTRIRGWRGQTTDDDRVRWTDGTSARGQRKLSRAATRARSRLCSCPHDGRVSARNGVRREPIVHAPVRARHPGGAASHRRHGAGMQGANAPAGPIHRRSCGPDAFTTPDQFGFAKGRYRSSDPRRWIGSSVDARIHQRGELRAAGEQADHYRGSRPAGVLKGTIAEMRSGAMVALGRSCPRNRGCSAGEGRRSEVPSPMLPAREIGPGAVFDSYHCSRYNNNTGRIDEGGCSSGVFAKVRSSCKAS